MSTTYHQLLDATIWHLERLKSDGVRFVEVSASALKALSAPSPAPLAHSLSQAQIESRRSEVHQKMPVEKPTPSEPETANLQHKAAALDALRAQALACTKCPHLAASRKTVVFGIGDMNSPLMFVGEAPGADEDQQGEPFVGRAGQLLTRIIEAMGVKREQVYIANILKCRPDTPGETSGNRKPTLVEMETCVPYLHQQIDLIQPKVIVGLGGTAVEGLLGKPLSITKLRGQWQTYRAIPFMPTFHPSYLLRPENSRHKRSVWEDMLQVMEKLSWPVTEKQRNFFMKA
jgi:DNA polymerase